MLQLSAYIGGLLFGLYILYRIIRSKCTEYKTERIGAVEGDNSLIVYMKRKYVFGKFQHYQYIVKDEDCYKQYLTRPRD